VDGEEVEELRHREYDGEGLHAYQSGVPAVQFNLLDGQPETKENEGTDRQINYYVRELNERGPQRNTGTSGVLLFPNNVPHGEQGERPCHEPGGGRCREALGAPRPDVVEARERRGRADHAGEHREDDEEPGRRVADGEVDRREVRRQRQPGICVLHWRVKIKKKLSRSENCSQIFTVISVQVPMKKPLLMAWLMAHPPTAATMTYMHKLSTRRSPANGFTPALAIGILALLRELATDELLYCLCWLERWSIPPAAGALNTHAHGETIIRCGSCFVPCFQWLGDPRGGEAYVKLFCGKRDA
jgi:hypothetical protein